MIYFIKSPQGPIKIGTTIRLTQRLRALASEHGQGLEVLAVADGSFEVERNLHRRFAHLRKVGEWFEPGDDLLGFIVSDGKPWDGSDEAEPLDQGTMIRVSAGFAQTFRKACTLLDLNSAEFVDHYFFAQVEQLYREALDKESKRMKPSK